MRAQVLAAVSALFILPAAAYLFGRNSAPSVLAFVQPEPFATATPRESTPPDAVRSDAVPRVPFVELYRSLQRSPYSVRRERVRELRNMSDLRQRRPAISSLFKCLAMIDAEEALTLLPELETDSDRIKALAAIVKGAPSAATATLVQRVMNMNDAVGEYFRAQHLPGQIAFWSALDPVAAAQFVEDHPELHARIGETALLTNWAAVDPAAATAWLQKHPQFIADENVLNDYVYGLYQNDPEIARQYVTDNATDPRFAKFIAPVAGVTFHRSPDAAETFIRGLPDAELRRRGLSAIAFLQAELLSDGSSKSPEGPRQVADWLQKFPAEERKESVAALFLKWAEQDSPEAVQWLGAISGEDQQAIIDLCGRAIEPDSWPQMLSAADGQLRRRFLASFAQAWSGTAAEIEKAARTSGLTPQDAATLKRLVTDRQP